jgi:hypothetical protein
MAIECVETQEWIEEEVTKPVEEWVEKSEKKCKNWPWPLNWACKVVTTLVKVVTWVVEKVGKWVVRTVCKFVSALVDMVRNVLTGLWDVIAGIVTLDWRRILDGLLGILVGLVDGILRLARIVYLVDTLDFIFTEINRERLRRYVRKILEAKYSGDEDQIKLEQIKEAIRLDHGAFGLRLNGTVYRTFLDSETPSPTEPTIPNLVILDETGAINLKALCGFEFDEGFWNRKRYKTLKKGLVAGGGGGGEVNNPISEDELDTYLSSRGAEGPTFIVLPLRDSAFNRHVSTAEDKGRELAIMLSFEKTTKEVTQAGNIVHNGSQGANADLLICVLGRTSKNSINPSATAARCQPLANDAVATSELCEPVGAAVFRYTNTLRGLASNLRISNCSLPGSNASGVTYIDNKPDQVWKYVLIHEFGHYFGLCHADGLDRIMYSSTQSSWWRWQVIPNLVGLKGEPYFPLSDGKAAWDYIVDNFEPQCLGADPEEPPMPVIE